MGAACGSWWSGDFDDQQIPEAYTRTGEPRGYMLISFNGNQFEDRFKATSQPASEQMSLSLNSPNFRDWFTKLKDWVLDENPNKKPFPPVSANHLGDSTMLTPDDLAETDLVINLWNGSRDSEVWVQFDDQAPVKAERTQAGEGEGPVESLDPYALRRQLSVLRYAMKGTESEKNEIWNGDLGDRADGFELFNAAIYKDRSQKPLDTWLWTETSNHIWTAPVPVDLAEGMHRVVVRATELHGQKSEGSLLIEVRTPNSSVEPTDNDPTDEKYYRQGAVEYF